MFRTINALLALFLTISYLGTASFSYAAECRDPYLIQLKEATQSEANRVKAELEQVTTKKNTLLATANELKDNTLGKTILLTAISSTTSGLLLGFLGFVATLATSKADVFETYFESWFVGGWAGISGFVMGSIGTPILLRSVGNSTLHELAKANAEEMKKLPEVKESNTANVLETYISLVLEIQTVRENIDSNLAVALDNLGTDNFFTGGRREIRRDEAEAGVMEAHEKLYQLELQAAETFNKMAVKLCEAQG
ncbi:MAG: hypothetical protein AB7F43_10885 [Bacteriovoracia bacterium]